MATIRSREPLCASIALVATRAIEQPATRGFGERMGVVLAVPICQLFTERCELRNRGEATIDPRATATARLDFAAQQNLARLVAGKAFLFQPRGDG